MTFKEKINQPSTIFDKPADVLNSEDLDDDQKMKALVNWKQTCIQLQKSSEEGMDNNKVTNQAKSLMLVSDAIEKLKERIDS